MAETPKMDLEQVADRVDAIIRSALSGDEPSFRTPEGHIRWGRVGHEIRVVILAADLGERRAVPPEEPSEEATKAAYRVLWGKDPEYDGGFICVRDDERWNETIAMLTAAYAVERSLSGGTPTHEGET